MRLVLSNPHIHLYGKTVLNKLISRKSFPHYNYFIKHYILNEERDVAFFIDGTRSSFNDIGVRFKIFPKFFSYLEVLVWMLINGINPLKVKVYFKIDKLNPQNDVIFNFSFTTLDNYPKNNEKNVFQNYDGIIINHLTHYLNDTSKISDNIKKMKHCFLVAESNLADNEYFKNYFPGVGSVYQLPFTFSDRFKKKKEFKDRINKCFAIGTLSIPGSKDYADFFGERVSMHPMRKMIYDKRNEYNEQIDPFIFNYDDTKDIKKISPGDSFLLKIAKKYLPYFILDKMITNYKTQYFNFDIVDKYNSYKMFISPEEIIGLPSINAFEGLACGGAFVGIDHPIYTNLGLRGGVNYISYKENDYADLLDKIRYYQENQEELEEIAENGYRFALDKFDPEKVASLFWNDLEAALESFRKGKLEFNSSINK